MAKLFDFQLENAYSASSLKNEKFNCFYRNSSIEKESLEMERKTIENNINDSSSNLELNNIFYSAEFHRFNIFRKKRSLSDDSKNYLKYSELINTKLKIINYQKNMHREVVKKSLTFKNLAVFNLKTSSKGMKMRKDRISDQIRNVIEILVKWKNLCYHLTKENPIKNITKEEGAKLLGIKKKTLDEFLGISRKGILLNYDFVSNMKRKFSELRFFVKQSIISSKWRSKTYRDVEDVLQELNSFSSKDINYFQITQP